MTASIVYTEHIKSSSTKVGSDQFDFSLPATNKISSNKEAFLSEPGTLIQVSVDTSIKALDSEVAKESGTFIYSFFVPQSSHKDGQPFYSVIPKTYSEMMQYVEGRRRAQDTAHFVDTLPK